MPPTRPGPTATESELLDWLRRQPATAGLVGDDAALLSPGGDLAVTVDCQIAGTHLPADVDPETFARRLLAVNLSDLAATGARPTHGFLVLAAPAEFPRARFLEAFTAACEEWRVVLAGGDLSRAEAPTATLTLLGEPWPDGRWVRRRDAVAGQALWLGGPTGESALGCGLVARGARLESGRARLPDIGLPKTLEAIARQAVQRHLAPRPQLELGRWLASRRAAATDVSDGLSRDLGNLCRSSGVGAEIDEDRLPVVAGLRELAEWLGIEPREALLGGGEDYVLLFTLDQDVEPATELGCSRIGRVTATPELLLRDGRGTVEPLAERGWDHWAD